jgi:hypothetical protein
MTYGSVSVVWTPDLDARLCDLVAQDEWSFGDIARLMNLPSRDSVTSRWRRLVVQMGYQAQWPTPAGPGKHLLSGEQKTSRPGTTDRAMTTTRSVRNLTPRA